LPCVLNGIHFTIEQEGDWYDRSAQGGRSRGCTNASEGRSQDFPAVHAALDVQTREKGQKGKNFKPEEERQ